MHRLIDPDCRVLKLFVKERRNDLSAEAIKAMLDVPEHYELVTEALAKLKTDGDHDRILAETD